MKMKKNMSSTDSIIRILIAALITVLFFTKIITGTFAIVMIIVAAIFLATSVIGFCPLYSLIGVKTCKTKSNL